MGTHKVPIVVFTRMKNSRLTLATWIALSAFLHSPLLLFEGYVQVWPLPTGRPRAMSIDFLERISSPSIATRPADIEPSLAAPFVSSNSFGNDAEAETPSALPGQNPVEEYFWAPEDVDKRASPHILPEDAPFPESSDATGHLIMKMYIRHDGTLDHVEVVTLTLPEHLLPALIDQAMRIRFAPAERAGGAVASWKLMEVVYEAATIADDNPTPIP